MTRISVTEYAALKKITRQAVLQQINWATKKGNKLHDGSFFEKVGKTYVIEISDELEKIYQSSEL
jgi:hypothetical protein